MYYLFILFYFSVCVCVCARMRLGFGDFGRVGRGVWPAGSFLALSVRACSMRQPALLFASRVQL